MSSQADTRHLIVQDIKILIKKLPSSLPIAERDSKIYTTLQQIHGETHWATFNRRFDILYGAELRNKATNRLPNIERGKFGLDAISAYLERIITESGMNAMHEPMMLKLTRLKDELVFHV
jgi:hypothetical protein